MWRAVVLAMTLAVTTAPLLRAQQQQDTRPPTIMVSPVLIIDLEALFRGSLYGAAAIEEYDTAGLLIEAENDAIEEQFKAEERALAEQRPDMTPEEFRAAAEDFDVRAQQARREQLAKGAELLETLELREQEFYAAALPILRRIMRDRGAAVLLSNDQAILSLSAVDITAESVRAVNEVLGTGQ